LPTTLPTREQYDLLITDVYGNDPRPPSCALHTDPIPNRHTCDPCDAFFLWRARMYDRFRRRGLRFTLDQRAFDDPKPHCPLKHPDTSANRKICEHCKARHNWQSRQYKRMNRAGVARRFTDLDTLRHHLDALEDAGLTAADIAHAAGCGKNAVYELLSGHRQFVRADLARRLLAVPIPDRRVQLVPDAAGRRLRRIDSTGTRRRIQAAARNSHSLASQARRLGWSVDQVREWTTSPTVTTEAAEAVATLFPSLITRRGSDADAATMAAQKGWVEARYFARSNIDDPQYNPFQIIKNPRGVYRRLRALAWDGQGPSEVAEYIGEAPEQVEIWMEGGPAPAYASHMVAAAFEALAGREGPDQRAADRARHMGWSSWPAWYEVDMDSSFSKPRHDLLFSDCKTDYPLESQVFLALMGRVPQEELLHIERVRAVRFLHRLGWSDRRIAAWLDWNPDGDLDKGRGAVQKFRQNNEIDGGGTALHGVPGRDTAEGAVAAPSAA